MVICIYIYIYHIHTQKILIVAQYFKFALGSLHRGRMLKSVFFIAVSPERLATLCQALGAIAVMWWWVLYVDEFSF